MAKRTIVEIDFILKFADGSEQHVEFHHPDKIKELMTATDAIGAFLKSIVRSAGKA